MLLIFIFITIIFTLILVWAWRNLEDSEYEGLAFVGASIYATIILTITIYLT